MTRAGFTTLDEVHGRAAKPLHTTGEIRRRRIHTLIDLDDPGFRNTILGAVLVEAGTLGLPRLLE